MPVDSDDDFAFDRKGVRVNKSPRNIKECVLKVHVLEGRRMRTTIASEGIKPFVVLRVGNLRAETIPKRSTRAAWNEEFSFKVPASARMDEDLVVGLWNANTASTRRRGLRGEMLGEKIVPIQRIEEMFCGDQGHWFTLSNACGQIKLKFTLERRSASNGFASTDLESDNAALNKIKAALRRTDSAVTVGHAATFLGRTFRTSFDREELMQFACDQRWASSTRLEAEELFEMYSHVEAMRGSNEGNGPMSSVYNVGDKVEAQFGQGKAFYPGTITKRHRDGTYDISYDDGDEETNVALAFIKIKKKHGLRGRRSVSPRRESTGRNGRSIAYEEGLSTPESGDNSESWDSIEEELRMGQRVEARFKGGKSFYKGNVTRVERNGTYTIRYDDGDVESSVNRKLIRVLGSERQNATAAAKKEHFAVGDKVSARYKGGSKFYSGELVRRNRTGSWAILYDDGDREDAVKPELIRKQSSGVKTLQRNDKVEIQLKHSKRYAKGKVLQANRDGSFHIRYDTGTPEKHVDASRIRPLPSSPSSNSSDESYLETRRHDKHPGKHRSRSMSSRGHRPSHQRHPFRLDDRVTFKAGHGRKGKLFSISRVHADKTYDVIQTNTGKVLKRIEQVELQRLPASSSSDSRSSDEFERTRTNRRSRSRSRSRVQKEASIWAGLRKLAIQEGRDPPALQDVLAEANEERRLESVLGRRRVRELRKAFDKYDRNGDGVITAVEVKKTLLETGTHVDNQDIRDWVHRRDRNRDGVIDFLEFLDAYATVTIKIKPNQYDSSGNSSKATNSAFGSGLGSDVDVDVDVESDVDVDVVEGSRKWREESWAKSLGGGTLRRLKRAFLNHCVTRRSGAKVIHIKHVRQCFAAMAEVSVSVSVCSTGMMADYMNVMGFSKNDVLAFREFAHAYHWLFHSDQDGDGDEEKGGGFKNRKGKVYKGERLAYKSLRKEAEGSIGEIAARVYQSGDFTGTREDHAALLRVLMVGRLPEEVAALKRLFVAFERADNDEDGEVETADVVHVLRNAEINPGPLKHTLAAFCSERRVTTLAELLAAIGFALAKQHLAVPECFAVLRLHHKLDIVREMANYVVRVLSRILENPADVQRWDISATSAGFKATVGTRKGGIELLNACGFVETPSKRWYRLAAASKGQITLKGLEISQLRLRREEVLKELSVLDGGVKPLPDALRLMRCTDHQAIKALQLASSSIVNVLKHPKDPRHWRVRADDSQVVAAFQGFQAKDAAKHLFEAIYFQPSADNKAYVLQQLQSDLKPFAFPSVDDDLEKALWRRKAEVDSMLRELETRIAKGGPNVLEPTRTVARVRQHSGNGRKEELPRNTKQSNVDMEALEKALRGEGGDRAMDCILKGVGFLRLLNSAALAQVGAERMISFSVTNTQGKGEKVVSLRASVVEPKVNRYNGFKAFLQSLGWKVDVTKKVYLVEPSLVQRRLKQLGPHILALRIPGLQDERAIKAAVTSVPQVEKPRLNACMETVAVYLENILDRPHESSVRTINSRNVNFRRRVTSCAQGLQIMVACGFRESPDAKLVFPASSSLSIAETKLKDLRQACTFLTNQLLVRTPSRGIITTPIDTSASTSVDAKGLRRKARRQMEPMPAALVAAKSRIRSLEQQVHALRERERPVGVELGAKGKPTFRLPQDLLPCKTVPWRGAMPWNGPAKLEIGEETRLVVSSTYDCLILDCPLLKAYPRGTLMKLVKPGKNEVQSLQHRRVVHFVRHEILGEVVEATLKVVSASDRGGDALRSGNKIKARCVKRVTHRVEEAEVVKVERDGKWTCVLTAAALLTFKDTSDYWNVRILFACVDRGVNGLVTVKDLLDISRHQVVAKQTLSPALPMLQAMPLNKTVGWEEYLQLVLVKRGIKVEAENPLEQAMEASYALVQHSKGFGLTTEDLSAVSTVLDGEQVDHRGAEDDQPMSLLDFKRLRRQLGKTRAERFNTNASSRSVRELLVQGYGLIDIAAYLNQAGKGSGSGDLGSVRDTQRQELEKKMKMFNQGPPRQVSRLELGLGLGLEREGRAVDVHVNGQLNKAFVLSTTRLYAFDLSSPKVGVDVDYPVQASSEILSCSLGLLVVAGRDGSVSIHDPLTLAAVQQLKLTNCRRIRGVYISAVSPVVVVATDEGLEVVDRNGIPLVYIQERTTCAAIIEEAQCVGFVDGKNCLKTLSFTGMYDVVDLVKTLLNNRDIAVGEHKQLDHLQLPLSREDIHKVQGNGGNERLQTCTGLNRVELGTALVSQVAKLDQGTGFVLYDVLNEWNDEAECGFGAELKSVVEEVLGVWLMEEEMEAIKRVCKGNVSTLADSLVHNRTAKRVTVVDSLGGSVSDLAYIAENHVLVVICRDGTLLLYALTNDSHQRSLSTAVNDQPLHLVYKVKAVQVTYPLAVDVRLARCYANRAARTRVRLGMCKRLVGPQAYGVFERPDATAVVYVINGVDQVITVGVSSSGVDPNWITLEDEASLVLGGYPVYSVHQLSRMKGEVVRVFVVASTDTNACAVARSAMERDGLSRRKLADIKQCLQGIDIQAFYACGDGPDRELDCVEVGQALGSCGGDERTCKVEAVVVGQAKGAVDISMTTLWFENINRSKRSYISAEPGILSEKRRVEPIAIDLCMKALNATDNKQHLRRLFDILCVLPDHWGSRYTETVRAITLLDNDTRRNDWLSTYLSASNGMSVEQCYATTVSGEEIAQFLGAFGMFVPDVSAEQQRLNKDQFVKTVADLLVACPFKPGLVELRAQLHRSLKGVDVGDNAAVLSVVGAERAYGVGELFRLGSGLRDELCRLALQSVLVSSRKVDDEGIASVSVPLRRESTNDVVVVELYKGQSAQREFSVGTAKVNGRGQGVRCQVWRDKHVTHIAQVIRQSPFSSLFPKVFPRAVIVGDETSNVVAVEQGTGRTLSDILHTHGPLNDNEARPLLYCWMKQLLQIVVALRTHGLSTRRISLEDLEVSAEGTGLRVRSLGCLKRLDADVREDNLYQIMLGCFLGLEPGGASASSTLFGLVRRDMKLSVEDLCKWLEMVHSGHEANGCDEQGAASVLCTLLVLHGLGLRLVTADDVLESGIFDVPLAQAERSSERHIAKARAARGVSDFHGVLTQVKQTPKASIVLHALKKVGEARPYATKDACFALFAMRESVLKVFHRSDAVLSTLTNVMWSLARRASAEGVAYLLETTLFLYAKSICSGRTVDVAVESALRPFIDKLCGLTQAEEVIKAATSHVQGLAALYQDYNDCESVYHLPSAEYIQTLVTLGANLVSLSASQRSQKRATSAARQIVEVLLTSFKSSIAGLEANRAVEHLHVVDIVAGWIYTKGSLRTMMLQFLEQAYVELDRQGDAKAARLKAFASAGVVGRFAGILKSGQLVERIAVQAIIKVQKRYPLLFTYLVAAGLGQEAGSVGHSDDAGPGGFGNEAARVIVVPKAGDDRELVKILTRVKEAVTVDEMQEVVTGLEAVVRGSKGSALLDAALLHLWSCTFFSLLKVVTEVGSRGEEKTRRGAINTMRSIVNLGSAALDDPNKLSSVVCEGGAADCFNQAVAVQLQDLDAHLALFFAKLCNHNVGILRKKQAVEAFRMLSRKQRSGDLTLLQALVELWKALIRNADQGLELGDALEELLWRIDKANGFKETLALGVLRMIGKERKRCPALIDRLSRCVRKEASMMKRNIGDFEWNLLHALAEFEVEEIDAVLKEAFAVPMHVIQGRQHSGLVGAVRWQQWSKSKKP